MLVSVAIVFSQPTQPTTPSLPPRLRPCTAMITPAPSSPPPLAAINKCCLFPQTSLSNLLIAPVYQRFNVSSSCPSSARPPSPPSTADIQLLSGILSSLIQIFLTFHSNLLDFHANLILTWLFVQGWLDFSFKPSWLLGCVLVCVLTCVLCCCVKRRLLAVEVALFGSFFLFWISETPLSNNVDGINTFRWNFHSFFAKHKIEMLV